MAIRAAALRKPRARVMRALIWALRASARPFDGPPSNVAQMRSLNLDRVLASFLNSGIWQRYAQAVTPVSRALPASPLTLNASRSCSLIRYPLYICLLSAAMTASAVRWFPVSFSGFLRSAHIPVPSAAAWSSFPAARSSAAMRRRSSSTRSPAPLTTWKASRQIFACSAFSRTTSWIHSAPSAETWVSSLLRSGPRASKNSPTVSWQRPSAIHAIVPRSWSVTTTRYLSSPLPQDFSSIPIRRSPASRSRRDAASAATRVTMLSTASHVIRSSFAAFAHGICAASHLRLHHDEQDLLRRAALPRPRLDIRRDHLDALAVEHLIPHRPGHRTNPAVSNHHVKDRDAIPGQPARFRPTRYAGYLKPRYLKGRESRHILGLIEGWCRTEGGRERGRSACPDPAFRWVIRRAPSEA